MPRPVPRRWNTAFGRFVRRYGVSQLAQALRSHGHPVTPKAIYNWVSGDFSPPLGRALAIRQLALERGEGLRLGQFHRNAVEIRSQSAPSHTADRTPLG